MKTFCLTLLSTLAFFTNINAQNINIPDPILKFELTTTNCVFVNGVAVGSVDTNGDGEVQVSEALTVTELRLSNEQVSSVIGLEAFTNLEEIVFLYYGGNSSWPLVFDFNQLTQLKKIDAYVFPFDVLSVNQLQNLEVLSFYSTGGMNAIDLSNNSQLKRFSVGPGGGSFATLDFSNCPLLESLNINNGNVGSLNIKNGSVLNPNSFNVNATYICVDPQEETMVRSVVSPNTVVNAYCSFTPGGDFKEINGEARFNIAGGCTSTDPLFNNMSYSYTDGNLTGSVHSTYGDYNIYVPDGQYTVTPQIENPSYWNITPPNLSVNFPTQMSPQIQDFCVSANGMVEDLEVMIFEMSEARPGFDVDYKVVVRNKGNQIASGTVTLDYENNFMTLLSTSPTASMPAINQLSWNFSNLNPLSTTSFDYTMTLNTPTAATYPLNIGDDLTFTATALGTGADAMPADNILIYNQELINSYDPNDKTCLQGSTITPSAVGDYVYYRIRFENLGTASAINVVIKDEINISQFDVSTLVPLASSHDYVTRVSDNNVVEFIFENINLDFNDATNDGYVVFKIKTLTTLQEGDTFDNTAGIYFDFNAPVITNTEVVTVMSTASSLEVTDESISIYPNPSKGIISINSTNNLKSAVVYDLNGRVIKQVSFTGNSINQSLDFSSVGKGVYFLSISTSLGSKVEKLILQ